MPLNPHPRSAIQINVWKTGMKILADYKRRKDLRPYLPHSEHWKLKNDRKNSINKSAQPSSPLTSSPHY